MKEYKLLEKLISIPSFVSDKASETKFVKYMTKYFQDNFPELQIELQQLEGDRLNLYIGSKFPELLVIGHTDTVQVVEGWETDPFTLTKKGKELFGLGVSDMKGSIAAFLDALNVIKKEIAIGKLGILLYADEEYDFLGIKSFVKTSKDLNPKLILSLDGRIEAASGCRGCIEISMTIKGESGHSRLAPLKKNIIQEVVKLSSELSKELQPFFSKQLGPSSVNLAAVKSGGVDGNIIPSKAKIIIEVRPATTEITADYVLDILKKQAKSQGIEIGEYEVRHDLCPNPSSYDNSIFENIKQAYKAAKVEYKESDRRYSGYLDIAMLKEISNSPTCVIGVGENGHIPNESMKIIDYKNGKKVYTEILKTFCNK